MPIPLPVPVVPRGQGNSIPTESEQDTVAEDTEKTQPDAPTTEWQEDAPQFQSVNGYYPPQDMYSPEYVVYESSYPFMQPDLYYGTPTCVLVPYSAMADFSTMHGLGVPCLPQEYAYPPYYHMLPMQQAPAMAAT